MGCSTLDRATDDAQGRFTDAATQGPAAAPVFWSGRRPSYAELDAA